jgi:hypothetical protein
MLARAPPLAARLDMKLTKRLWPCAALACGVAWACANEVPIQVEPREPNATAGVGGTSGGIFIDDSAGASGSAGSGGRVSCGAPDEDESCGAETFEGKSVALDIYIVFDQSASMCACLDPGAGQLCQPSGCETTRLDAVRNAIEEFSTDPDNAGVGVGLGLFGNQEIGETSCEASAYGAPVVDVGTLPEQAEPLREALRQLAPVGETPTGPALRGACGYARDYRNASDQHQVVLLLLTDGRPEAPTTCRGGESTCCPSLDDAVLAADECRQTTGIRTFVIGVGPLLDNLEQIAVAGGTDQAYLVEGGDVGTAVRTALNRIRGAASIPCELQLPQPPLGEALDLNAVNVSHEAEDCSLTQLAAVPGADDCGDEDGWFYDDPTSPGRVLLCPRSCERVSGPGGNLYYSVGCETRIR